MVAMVTAVARRRRFAFRTSAQTPIRSTPLRTHQRRKAVTIRPRIARQSNFTLFPFPMRAPWSETHGWRPAPGLSHHTRCLFYEIAHFPNGPLKPYKHSP
jgi:hypothetical protein